MNELKTILESSVLTDEVKAQLQEAFESQVNEKVAAREVEMAEKMEAAKKELAESTIEMIEEAVTEEFKAIQDEIVEARSLDVRYAIKLEEFKEQYAQKKDAEVKEMVESVISEEMGELRESLEEARKNLAGKRMFEAFQATYGELLSESVEDNGEDVAAQLKEAQEELDVLRREKKLNELLEGVTGRKRTIMETLLEGVSTEKLESRYNDLAKNVLLQESKEDKEDNLEEAADEEKEAPKGTAVFESNVDDEDAKEVTSKDWLKRARRMAGVE